jgi:lysophospholipase
MDLVEIPENPVPSGAVTGIVETRDGARLRFARWQPTSSERRLGTVCVFQGRGEFIEKYFEVVADLRRRGFAVAVLDWRGQGGSDRLLRNPRKSHIDSFAQYDRDLAAFMDKVVLPDCPPPLFALGHSTGGAILLRNATRRPNWFERMVLSAPLIALADVKLSRAFMRFAVETLCFAGLSTAYIPWSARGHPANDLPFADNPYTSDPERFYRTRAIVEAAPHIAVGGPTFGWLAAVQTATRGLTASEFAARLAVPVLMVAAGEEHIVSNHAIEQLALRLKIGGQIVIPGARHELLMERDRFREQFWAAFDAFVPGDHSFQDLSQSA